GDVDGDGKAEVLVAHDHDHNIVIFELFFDQTGRMLVRTVVKADSPADFNTGNGFAVGNLDGEGGAEILVAHQSDHIIEIFTLLPNGTFTSRKIPTTFNKGNGFAVGDVDN